MILEDEFQIYKFAKKHVLRLSASNTLWDVVEMMNDFSIRHVPIVKGSRLLGVMNPYGIMRALQSYRGASAFDQPLEDIVTQDYLVVDDNVSVLHVIEELLHKRDLAALVMNDASFHGIFTEADILHNNYLWSKIEDFPIHSQDPIGEYIDEFTCVPSHTSIYQALTTMATLQTECMGIIDEHSKILVGTLSFMDIIHNLMHHYKELGSDLEFIWETPINAIFPQSGLYVQEPIFLSEIRQKMYDNNIYLTVLLNENNYPVKIISTHDIIQMYIQASGFMDNFDTQLGY